MCVKFVDQVVKGWFPEYEPKAGQAWEAAPTFLSKTKIDKITRVPQNK